MKKRILGNKRGDSLIEVVVSFLVVMLMLIAVTTMILTACKLNDRSALFSETMAMSVDSIEASDRSAAPNDSMSVVFDDYTSVSIPVAVESTEMIDYFYPN